jgi:hypothetical protein
VDPDPDERRDGGPEPDAGLDDFDRIVAGLRLDGPVPDWPDERPAGESAPTRAPEEEDHFVPPEPPPLPRLGPPALVGMGLLGLGLVLVATPGWIGIPPAYALPLGLLALSSGLGWLVLRLWPTPPQRGDGDGEDDGAVL